MSVPRVWRGSGGPAVRAYRRALDRLRSADPAERASVLQAMAHTEEPAALRALKLDGAAGWTPLWSAGRRSAFHTRLAGLGGPVSAVAFGEAGGRAVVATGGADQTVRLWDPRRGELRATLAGHTGAVSSLAFGPVGDRSVLASAGADRTVRLWDPDGAEPLRTFRVPKGRVVDVALAAAADGRTVVAAASEDGRSCAIDAWDPGTGKRRYRKRFFRETAYATGSLAVVPTAEGDLLATFDEDDAAVLLLDPVTGAEIRSLQWEYTGNHGDLDLASFVPPLVVSRHDGRVCLGATAQAEIAHMPPNTDAIAVWWDVLTGEVAHQRELAMNESLLAATTVDGRGQFATVTALSRSARSAPRTAVDLRIVPVGAGLPIAGLTGHTGHVRAAAFGTVDGAAVLATAGEDGTVLLWDAGPTTAPRWDELGPGSGLAVVADPERPVLVVGGSGPSVALLDSHTGSTIGSLRCQVRAGQPGHDCPDMTREAGWYVSRDHCRHSVAAGVVDGRWLVATRGDETGMLLWDPVSHEVVRVIEQAPPGGTVRFGVAGGRSILVAGNSTPDVWDPATGTRLATLRDEHREMYGPVSVAVGSVRGRAVVAVAGTAAREFEFAVDVWDPLTGEHLRRLPIHAPVRRRHPPGTRGDARLAAAADLLAVADDDLVHLWDPGSGEHLSTVRGKDGPVTCVELATVADRTVLVVGTAGGTVRLWTTGPGEPRPVATLATFARPVHAVATAGLAGQPYVFCQATTGRLTACRIDTLRRG